MKSLCNFAALLVLCFSIVLSGCSKESENPVVPPDDNFEPYLSVKVDGQLRQSTGITVLSGSQSLNMLQIIGYAGNYTLHLVFKEDKLKTGTIPLKYEHVFTYGGVSSGEAYTTMHDLTGGTCTITKLTDTEIAGTFECYATDFQTQKQIHITDGKFRTKLPVK